MAYLSPLLLLKKATLRGNKDRIMEIFQQYDIKSKLRTYKDEVGDTFLHFALQTNKSSPNEIIEILDIFISRGADPNIKNRGQETVLHLAIAKRYREVIDYLLQRGAKIDVTEDQGNSLLHTAIKNLSDEFLPRPNKIHSVKMALKNRRVKQEKESAAFVKWLLSRGCDCDCKNKKGQSPLHLAIKYNLQHVLPALLRYTRDVNFVSEPDNATLLQLFLNTIHAGNKSRYSFGSPKRKVAFKVFSRPYKLEIASILLERGVSVDHEDKHGRTALNLAIDTAETTEDMEIVEIIFNRFTRFHDARGYSLLCTLIKKTTFKRIHGDCYLNMLATLIKNGAHLLNAENKRRPIDKKTVNCRNQLNKSTPLHLAVDYSFAYVVKLLLDNGANINSQAQNGRPLHQSTDKSILKFLLRRKAEVNARDSDGNSALARAIMADWTSHVEELLAHGADVNDICVIQAVEQYRNEAQISVLRHCLKLKAANLPYSVKYNPFLVLDERQDFHEENDREIHKLKSTYIDSYTSLYQWLRMDPNRRYLHYHSEALRNLVDSTRLLQQFAEYSTAIRGYYCETQTRRRLLEPAKKAWFKLTEIDLPDICLERVLAHLNTGYLFEIIEFAEEVDQ